MFRLRSSEFIVEKSFPRGPVDATSVGRGWGVTSHTVKQKGSLVKGEKL